MRVRVRRLLGVSALYLLFGLGVSGCSGQQQEDEGMEVSGQENEAAENEASGEDQAAAEEGGGEENQANNSEEGGNEEGAQEATEEGTEEAAQGGETENDLQEIISEMNGQQTDPAMAQPAGNVPVQETAPLPDSAADAAQAAPIADPAAAAPAADTAAAGPSTSPIPFQPGGSPAAAGLPEIGSKMAYVVESGDTLGGIAQKIYGSLGRWKELAELSAITNPSRIYPGDLVYYTLDESAVAFAKAYESVQRSEETVQPGDTLATIAKRLYGTTTAWRSLWRHNDKIDNPDIVAPGSTVYYVPKGAAVAAVNKARADMAKFASNVKSKSQDSGKVAVKTNGTHNSGGIAKVQIDNGTQLAGSQLSYDLVNVSTTGNIVLIN